jgi:hypothetical protein
MHPEDHDEAVITPGHGVKELEVLLDEFTAGGAEERLGEVELEHPRRGDVEAWGEALSVEPLETPKVVAGCPTTTFDFRLRESELPQDEVESGALEVALFLVLALLAKRRQLALHHSSPGLVQSISAD